MAKSPFTEAMASEQCRDAARFTFPHSMHDEGCRVRALRTA